MRRLLPSIGLLAVAIFPLAATAEDNSVGEKLPAAYSYASSTESESVLASFGDDSACQNGCAGSCDCCCSDGLLGGLIAPSDTCFTGFISPMTNPVFFEDPRTLTEARIIYLHHRVPQPALGGDINLIACQLRAAINDRLSVIATKDGYATSTNPLIDDGWADVSAGLKYNLYADYERQRLLSAGLTYELPVGSTRTQQGNGDGLFNLFLTGGMEFGRNNRWVSGTGFLLPADSGAESSLWFWSNHFDHRIGDTNLYGLVEFNWYHYMGSGRAFTLAPIEGGDLFNLGSVGVAGNDIVTGAFGLKYKPSNCVELGVAWELPLTDRRDVLDNRLTVDCILRY
jgi:hypothetical protein